LFCWIILIRIKKKYPISEKERPVKFTSKASIATIFILYLVSTGVYVNADDEPTLNVRGEAVLEVPPDQVSISVGVVTEAAEAKKAMASNSKTMAQVIKSLESLGLKKKNYETRQFNIQPIWSSRPRNADDEWQAKIVRYRVSNTLEINSTQLDLVGEMINAATDAGANKIHSIRFGLSNPREYRSQAIEQAINNARADADIAAVASGVEIDGVHRLQLDSAPSISQVKSAPMARAAMAEMSAIPPVNPGEIDVRASVYIEYKIKD
jgi:uncharacterized protein YggE